MSEDNMYASQNEREESRMLRFLYDTRIGHKMLKIAVKPYVSKTAGKVMDSRLSKVFIKHTVKKNALNLFECEKTRYVSYNDFFTRNLKSDMRVIDYEPSHLISPCDAQLAVYPINEGSVFNIKDSNYRLADLLKNEALAHEYSEGLCLIYRLTPNDYHHYFYIDNGIAGESLNIAGEFHTVRSLALAHYNIYKRNTRSYTVLYTEHFGKIVQIEVGALAVGKITNHHGRNHHFKRGEEKGLFEYGGSTVVLLIGKDIADIDSRIMTNSMLGYETRVLMGQMIGKKSNS